MGPFWGWRGYWNETRNWLKLALARADVEGVNSTPARAQVLLGLADGLGLGDHTIAQTLMTQSLKIYDELDDQLNSAYVLFRMGWLAREHDDPDTARLRFEESLSVYRELGDKSGICVVLISMGEVAVMQEDAIWATALLEEGLTLARELGITLMSGWALNHMGHVAQFRNEWERARQLHEASLVPFNEIGTRHEGIIWAHQDLGVTALAQGDATLAVKYFMFSLELCRSLGEPVGTAWCLAGFAGIAALNEEPERAAWLWGAAEALRLVLNVREAPASHAIYERLKAGVRQHLGEDVFNAKWAEGQAVSVDNAIVEAIG
jgi:tetratricopeptide (TPR) repeat protein